MGKIFREVEIKGNQKRDLGKEARDLCLKLYGNLTGNLGEESKNSQFYVKGDIIGEVGRRAYNCSFNIDGNVYSDVGISATECTFKIEKTVEGSLGMASQNCKFFVGEVECIPFSSGNYFYVKGNVKKGIYNLEDCVLIIEGDVRELYNLKMCRISVGGEVQFFQSLEGCEILCDLHLNPQIRKINGEWKNEVRTMSKEFLNLINSNIGYACSCKNKGKRWLKKRN